MICDKIVYTTKAAAIEAIKGLKDRGKKKSFHVYVCKDCGGLHIATAGKKSRARKQFHREEKYPFRYEPVVKIVKSKKKK